MKGYRILLRLFPASFRIDYGEELVAQFRARRRDATGIAVLRLWLETIADTLASAVAVHLDVLRQDLRYAARTLNRSRGFAAATVLITALGTGANTAVFSLTDHVLLRPLPFRDPERLVNVWEDQNFRGYGRVEPSPANYRDWKRANRCFDALEAYHTQSMNLAGRGEPLRLDGAAVTGGLFQMLGVAPVVGRSFTPGDDQPGAPGTVLLSHAAWRALFGGDTSIVGRPVALDSAPYVVIGVMPRDFNFPTRETTFWTTTRFAEDMFEDRANNFLHVVGRLRPGVALDEARAEMRVVAAGLEQTYPKENAHVGAAVRALRDDVSQQARLMLAALVGAALCVLLIACANLANLLLARSTARRRELALRAALGAGRERLVRQLLTETLALALAGGVLGVLMAVAALPLLARLVPTSLPIAEVPSINLRVLAVAASFTVLTAFGFGVLPCLRACRGANADDLHEGGRSGTARAGRLGFALIVPEVMASVVLLVAAASLLQALWRVQSVNPGFDPEGALTLRTTLPMPKYAETEARARFYDQVLSEVRRLPGVTAAGYTSFLPLVMRGGIWPVQVPGRADVQIAPESASARFVTPGYFDAMGIARRIGRDTSDADGPGAPFVAIVSESFARRFWPRENPLGRQFEFGSAVRTVAGVVADVRVRGLERESEPQVYLPYRQVADGWFPSYTPKDLVVRATGGTALLVPAVRAIVHGADPEQPVSNIRQLREIVDAETAPRLVQLRVLGAFAALALVLAATGIHAVLSFLVAGRRREIGVRVALGAPRHRILLMVVGETMALSAAGILIGLAVAWSTGRLLQALLAGVDATSPATVGVTAGTAALMSVAGSVLPALRALGVDPTTVMRAE
jgi:predicted permease